MKASLKIDARKDGKAIRLTVVGQMDEDVVYPEIKAEGCEQLILNLAGVSLINSTGLQKWVIFLESIPENLRLYAEMCSIRVINQVNLFPSFFAGRSVKIASFYAPYFCANCDTTFPVLLDTSRDLETMKHCRAPEQNCMQCHQTLEFDGLEKKYFKFLSRVS